MRGKKENHQWKRVVATDPDPLAQDRFEAREKTMKDKNFLHYCEKAGIPATPRQARKWNNKTGLAYKGKGIN